MREVNPGNVLGVQGCLHLNGLSPRSSTTQDQLTCTPTSAPESCVQAEAQEHIVGADKGLLNAQFYAQGELWQGVGMKPITCQK